MLLHIEMKFHHRSVYLTSIERHSEKIQWNCECMCVAGLSTNDASGLWQCLLVFMLSASCWPPEICPCISWCVIIHWKFVNMTSHKPLVGICLQLWCRLEARMNWSEKVKGQHHSKSRFVIFSRVLTMHGHNSIKRITASTWQ